MAFIQSAVDKEFRLRLRVGVDEFVEQMIGTDHSPPDVVEGLGADDSSLFSQAFLLVAVMGLVAIIT